MTIEHLATLIWRFIGLFAVITALPAIALLSFSRIGTAGARPPSLFQVLPIAFALAQAVAGILLMRFSGALGRLITRGLREP